MSWDILLFRLDKPINRIEEIQEGDIRPLGTWKQLQSALAAAFPGMIVRDNSCIFSGPGFNISMTLGESEDIVTTVIFRVNGEAGILPIIHLCKVNDWQAYDTFLGSMLDLNSPEINGYQNFQTYLKSLKNK